MARAFHFVFDLASALAWMVFLLLIAVGWLRRRSDDRKKPDELPPAGSTNFPVRSIDVANELAVRAAKAAADEARWQAMTRKAVEARNRGDHATADALIREFQEGVPPAISPSELNQRAADEARWQTAMRKVLDARKRGDDAAADALLRELYGGAPPTISEIDKKILTA